MRKWKIIGQSPVFGTWNVDNVYCERIFLWEKNRILLKEISITCDLEYSGKNLEYEIECFLNSPLIQTRIAIERSVIYDRDSLKVLIMPFYTEKKDFICLSSVTYEDKFFYDISFRQVSKFHIDNIFNEIYFNIYTVTTFDNSDAFFPVSVEIIINLIKKAESIESLVRCGKKNITNLQDREIK